MTKAKIDHKWSKKYLDEAICRGVAEGLRMTYKETSAALKHIARITQISEATARKWYQGANPPDAAHLLMLMAHYPAILRKILEIIERTDLWELAVKNKIPQRMKMELTELNEYYKIWGDKNVTAPANKIAQNSIRLNDRQLWFVDELQWRRRMQNKDIAAFWDVAERTAKRDTKALIGARLIHTVRKGSKSWYELTEEAYGR